MTFIPAIQMVGGSGKPRLIVVKAIPFYISTGTTTYTGSTVVEGGTPALLPFIRAGMRLRSFAVISGQPNKFTYAKVLSVDDSSNTITIDSWHPVTPTNNQAFTVDGWVIDLPYCSGRKLKETRSPYQNVHNLWRGRKAGKWFGWNYSCTLDYSELLWGSDLVNMNPVLSMGEDDILILIPRVDAHQYQYNVILSPDDIDVMRFGLQKAHSGVVLRFVGKELVSSWPTQSGYGTGYAENYGYQL